MSRILITIPTWNEAVVIERNLGVVQDAAKKYLPAHQVLIEVADNGSDDGTSDLTERMGVSVIRLTQKGKGLAIRTSWERHLDDTDVLVFMDADLAADVSALPDLIGPIMRGEADMVCGSRFLPGSNVERAPTREFASRVYRLLQKATLRLPVRDAQCGFKAVSARAARQLLPLCHENNWMFDSELLALAARAQMRVREIPVDWIEHREPSRRSALRLMRHGWGFLAGLRRIRQNMKAVKQG